MARWVCCRCRCCRPRRPEIGGDDDPLFSNYRKRAVAGADARRHDGAFGGGACAPCGNCRAGKPTTASELIAFGDPYFSKAQEAEAAAGEKVRLADAGGQCNAQACR